MTFFSKIVSVVFISAGTMAAAMERGTPLEPLRAATMEEQLAAKDAEIEQLKSQIAEIAEIVAPVVRSRACEAALWASDQSRYIDFVNAVLNPPTSAAALGSESYDAAEVEVVSKVVELVARQGSCDSKLIKKELSGQEFFHLENAFNRFKSFH